MLPNTLYTLAHNLKIENSKLRLIVDQLNSKVTNLESFRTHIQPSSVVAQDFSRDLS